MRESTNRKKDKDNEEESKYLSGRKIKKMRERKIMRENKSMRGKEEHSLMVK